MTTVEQTQKLSLIEGSLTQNFINWTTGSVLTGFMLHLGASGQDLALIASVPLLTQMISPFAAWFSGILGRRKWLVVVATVLGRGAWICAAMLPLLGLSPSQQTTFMVYLIAFSSILQSSAATVWQGWMGDVVPEQRRGKYFGLRAGLAGVVGTLGNLLAGWFLDRVSAPYNFQVVFFVGVGLALYGAFLLTKHYEPPVSVARIHLGETFLYPLQDRNFLRFLLFCFYWMAAVMVASPFVFPYFMKVLHMNFTQLSIWTAIASGIGMLTNYLWGLVADKSGNKPVLAIGTFCAGTLMPISWMLASITGNFHIVWWAAVFDALAWGAIGTALFNMVLACSPSEKRSSYFAMFNLTIGLAGFLGGMLGGFLMDTLSGVFSLTRGWTVYHTLFLISGLLRASAWILLKPVQEPKAKKTREVLWQYSLGLFWRKHRV